MIAAHGPFGLSEFYAEPEQHEKLNVRSEDNFDV